MRYFAHIAFNGYNYSGWQIQPNANSVQEEIEKSLSLILNNPTKIIGCGRTDKGVHASSFYFHFDSLKELPLNFTHRINLILPKDIVILSIIAVKDDAHARFDAISRSYTYYISLFKDPFKDRITWSYPLLKKADRELMQETADLLLNYNEFFPFCKTHSDAFTMKCDITEAKWIFKDDSFSFTITSNRFLRGMVRLIVGACINVGLGKLDLSKIQKSLDDQELLIKSWSVPPDGLFLDNVVYPYLNIEEGLPV